MGAGASVTEHTPHSEPDAFAVVRRALEYAANTLNHLASYTDTRGLVTDPDLHEDLREAPSWVVDAGRAAIDGIEEQLETLREAVQALHDWEDGWPQDPATLKELILEAHAVAYPASTPKEN